MMLKLNNNFFYILFKNVPLFQQSKNNNLKKIRLPETIILLMIG